MARIVPSETHSRTFKTIENLEKCILGRAGLSAYDWVATQTEDGRWTAVFFVRQGQPVPTHIAHIGFKVIG